MMTVQMATSAMLLLIAGLALGAGCTTPCGPSQACPAEDQRCVWLADENRGFCAPACGDDGGCPEGLACQQVAAGECWPCRVVSEACVAPSAE